jgi:hypothetical protein
LLLVEQTRGREEKGNLDSRENEREGGERERERATATEERKSECETLLANLLVVFLSIDARAENRRKSNKNYVCVSYEQ